MFISLNLNQDSPFAIPLTSSILSNIDYLLVLHFDNYFYFKSLPTRQDKRPIAILFKAVIIKFLSEARMAFLIFMRPVKGTLMMTSIP